MQAKTRGRLVAAARFIAFLLAMDLFFVAIKLLGAFKSLGRGYGEVLITDLAQNPFLALSVGILVTSVIQSSSTTTSLVVGLVAAGVLGDDPATAIELAVPIIMGANIGTSVTNTLVSLGQVNNRAEFERAYSAAVVHDVFNWLAVVVLLPLQVATNFLGRGAYGLARFLEGAGGLQFASPVKLLVGPQVDAVKRVFEGSFDLVELVVVLAFVFLLLQGTTFLARRVRLEKSTTAVGFAIALAVAAVVTFATHYREAVFHHSTAVFVTGLGLLFFSLSAVVRIMRMAVLDRVQAVFDAYVFRTGFRALLLGLVVTALVQSSSVTTSLIVPLAGAGLLNLHQVFSYTLGANIGTTVTALLAALSLGEVAAVSVALSHLLFNISGIALFYPVRRVPIFLARGLGRLALRSPFIPVGIVLGAYLGLPLLLIVVFG